MPVYIRHGPAEGREEGYYVPLVFESCEDLILDAYNWLHNNSDDFFITKEEIRKVLEYNGVYKTNPDCFYNREIYWEVMDFDNPTESEFGEPKPCMSVGELCEEKCDGSCIKPSNYYYTEVKELKQLQSNYNSYESKSKSKSELR